MSQSQQPPVNGSDFTITAKDSYAWTFNELAYFHVFFKSVDFQTFFRQEPDVLGPEWNTWLTAESPLDVVEDEKMWSVLEKVSELHDRFSGQDDRETLMDTLSTELLRLFGYIIPGKIKNRTSYETSFRMCGTWCSSYVDNALLDVHAKPALLGILYTESTYNTETLRPKIVAVALAVFNHNKVRRHLLTEVVVPVITMHINGGSPTFYLVPITKTFADDVAAGRSPNHETIILTYQPIPSTKQITYNLGLAAPANRLPITQAYLAFKKFLKPSGESPFPYDAALHSLQKEEDWVL